MSPAAKRLISELLNFDPSKRLTTKEVLQHEWMQDEQLMNEIATMQKNIEKNKPADQKENKSSDTTEASPGPSTSGTGKKRKMSFSLPQFLAGKRRKT